MIASATIVAAEEGGNPLLPANYELLWGSVCFLIILVFFWKFAWPRISKVLDERANLIEGGIKRAEEAQAEARKALDEYNDQLAKARKEAADIRVKAQTEGQQILADLKSQAQTDAQAIVTAAQAQTVADRAQAFESLKGEIGGLAVDLASRIVGSTLDDDAKAKQVVDEFIASLDAAEATK